MPASSALPPHAPAPAAARLLPLQLSFGCGLLCLSMLQLLHSWPALAAGTTFPNLNNDARSNPWLELGHTLGVCVVFFAYLRSLLRWREQPLSARQVVALLLPSSLLALLALPATSTDILFYIGIGRMLVLYGANPYLHIYEEFDDGFARYLDWPDATMPYGPLLLPYFSAGGWLSQYSPVGAIYLLKAFSFVVYLCLCWALYRLLRALGRDSAFGLFLFALNPLVLLDQIGSGHNDGLMLLFGVLGLWALARQRQALGLCLALLSTLCKLPGVVFLALLIARLVWRRQWLALARGAGFAALACGLLLALLFPSWDALLSLTNPSSTSVNSLHRLLLEAVTAWQGWTDESPGLERFYEAERALSLGLFVAYFLWRLLVGEQRSDVPGLVREQLRILLVILLGYTAWFLPWYTTWLLPLAAVTESRALTWVVVAYTASVTAFFAFPGSVLGQPWQVLRTLLAHGVPLALLLRAHLLARRERPRGAALYTPVGSALSERSP